MAKIINILTNKVIAEDNSLTIKELAIKNKANLRGANLRGANLCDADLRGADLRGADLRGANLRYANLRGANLCYANLCGANLRDANLCGANLRGADLCYADLRDADLRGANLCDANLCDADLRGADLRGADLRADLRGANLCYANLCGVDLRDADLRGVDLEHLKIWLNPCKRDILFVLANVPRSEVEGLRKKIIEGKIDGSQYEGNCCCLIGSLGNENAISSIPYYDKGIHNYGEQLFLQIKEGDTPETNQFSKVALELCDEVLNNNPKSYVNKGLDQGCECQRYIGVKDCSKCNPKKDIDYINQIAEFRKMNANEELLAGRKNELKRLEKRLKDLTND